MPAYIRAHWRGDHSLTRSFWINTILVSAGCGLLLEPLRALVRAGELSATPVLVPALLVGALALVALGVWQLVGLWRAAAGGGRPWRRLARGFVVAQVVLGVATAAVEAHALRAAVVAWLGDEPVGSYVVELRSERTLRFLGAFEYGAAEAVAAALRERPEVWLVELDSRGGRIGPAIDLATVLRQRKLTTYVGTRCLSACTIAFMGGTRRILHVDARVGLHAPYDSSGLLNRRWLNHAARAMGDTMINLGAAKPFVERALAEPSESLWYPSLADMASAGLVTHLFDGAAIRPAR